MHIDDAELLGLILCNYITFARGHVYKFHARRWRYYRITATQHPKDKRWRYNIRIGKRQRTIQRNRLIWMIVHRELIPHDVDVDHFDHDNENDVIDNLRLRDKTMNRSDNYSKANMDDVMGFFERVGQGSSF